MAHAVACANAKTSIQKVHGIGVGIIKPNIYSKKVILVHHCRG